MNKFEVLKEFILEKLTEKANYELDLSNFQNHLKHTNIIFDDNPFSDK